MLSLPQCSRHSVKDVERTVQGQSREGLGICQSITQWAKALLGSSHPPQIDPVSYRKVGHRQKNRMAHVPPYLLHSALKSRCSIQSNAGTDETFFVVFYARCIHAG